MKKSKYVQFIKFCISGVFNTAIDYGMFYLFISFCSFAKEAANTVSMLSAITVSYFLNKTWIFDANGDHFRFAGRFAVVNLAALCVSTFFIHILYDVFEIYKFIFMIGDKIDFLPKLTSHGALVVCKLIAAPFVTAISFFGNKYYVFRRK